MLRKSRALRNAGLRRRAPAHPAVPRHQLISRRSRNATGTDDRAALAAQPRPGAQEGGCGAAASSFCARWSRRPKFFAKSFQHTDRRPAVWEMFFVFSERRSQAKAKLDFTF